MKLPEVVRADMRWLKARGPFAFSYELAISKTNQDGQDGQERSENHQSVVGEAAVALRAWLQVAGISAGALFRRVGTGGRVGDGLSAAAVRVIMQPRCAAAEMVGDFYAHSLRSGFVIEAVPQEVPLAETMAMTGRRSVQSLVGYTRPNARRNIALRLLEKGVVPGKYKA